MAPPLFNQGDIGRQYLGANGTLKIFKCIQSNQIIVQYIDDSGEKKFEAEAPLPETAHLQLQGNAGYEPCIMWDAYNKQVTSGGTIVKGGKEASNPTMFRRFFFWFRSREQLTAVLSHLLYHDMSLLEEFFDDKGRFFAKMKPSLRISKFGMMMIWMWTMTTLNSVNQRFQWHWLNSCLGWIHMQPRRSIDIGNLIYLLCLILLHLFLLMK